jgi:UDP-glucose 4-epimerase
MVRAIEKASGKEVPYKIVDRRAGDIATCFADPAFALQEIGWKAEHGLDEMAEDTWRWQSNNPDGYPE